MTVVAREVHLVLAWILDRPDVAEHDHEGTLALRIRKAWIVTESRFHLLKRHEVPAGLFDDRCCIGSSVVFWLDRGSDEVAVQAIRPAGLHMRNRGRAGSRGRSPAGAAAVRTRGAGRAAAAGRITGCHARARARGKAAQRPFRGVPEPVARVRRLRAPRERDREPRHPPSARRRSSRPCLHSPPRHRSSLRAHRARSVRRDRIPARLARTAHCEMDVGRRARRRAVRHARAPSGGSSPSSARWQWRTRWRKWRDSSYDIPGRPTGASRPASLPRRASDRRFSCGRSDDGWCGPSGSS